MAPTPRWHWRRLALLTATALPILLLATAGCYLLIRYLAARDRLGAWTITLHDRNHAEVGHGHLQLVADGWDAQWSWSKPFVTFRPTLRAPVGTLAVTDWSFWDTAPLHLDVMRKEFTLTTAAFYEERFVVVDTDTDSDLTLLVEDEADCGSWELGGGGGKSLKIPCSVAMKRASP
jgi:hypothetical protein